MVCSLVKNYHTQLLVVFNEEYCLNDNFFDEKKITIFSLTKSRLLIVFQTYQ